MSGLQFYETGPKRDDRPVVAPWTARVARVGEGEPLLPSHSDH